MKNLHFIYFLLSSHRPLHSDFRMENLASAGCKNCISRHNVALIEGTLDAIVLDIRGVSGSSQLGPHDAERRALQFCSRLSVTD